MKVHFFDTLMILKHSMFLLAIHFRCLSAQWRPNLGHAALAGPGNTSQQAEELLTVRDSFWNGVEEALSYITPLTHAQAILLSHIWVITCCELHSLITKLMAEPANPCSTHGFPPVIRKNKQMPKVRGFYGHRILCLWLISGVECINISFSYRKKAAASKALCDRCVWRKILPHFFTTSLLIFILVILKEFKLWRGCGRVGGCGCKLYSTEYVKVALWFARHSLSFVLQKRGAEKGNILSKYSVFKFQHSSSGSALISTCSPAHSANKSEDGEDRAEWRFSEFPRHVGGCLWVFVFSLASLGRINTTRVTLVWVSHRTEHLRLWASMPPLCLHPKYTHKNEHFQIHYRFSSTWKNKEGPCCIWRV